MDQQKLTGYLVEKVFDCLNGVTYFTSQGAVLLLFISLCQHHEAFLTIFHHLLMRFQQNDKRTYSRHLLSNLVRFHNTAKKWVCFVHLSPTETKQILFSFFTKSAELYSPIILGQLICSVLFLACSAFQLNLVFTSEFPFEFELIEDINDSFI